MHELHEKTPQFARKRFLRAHDARALSLPLYTPARFACALSSVQKTFRSIGGISWEYRTIVGGSSVVIQKKAPGSNDFPIRVQGVCERDLRMSTLPEYWAWM